MTTMTKAQTTDLNEWPIHIVIGATEDGVAIFGKEPLFITDTTFTRSNGSIISRIYERLTKASRRRVEAREKIHFFPWESVKQEAAYRRGVYDAFSALRDELAD